jgi:hypothetical protein
MYRLALQYGMKCIICSVSLLVNKTSRQLKRQVGSETNINLKYSQKIVAKATDVSRSLVR